MNVKIKPLTEQKRVQGQAVIYPVMVLDDEGRTLSETPYMIPINADFDAALRKLPDWEAQLVTILRTRTLEKINHGKTPIREDHLKQDLKLIGREF